MKKIFVTVIFCTLFTRAFVFAGDDSVEAHITRTLYIMFKLPYTNCATSENDYQQKTIVYNGMHLTAFKSKYSGWIGFFKPLSPADLPAEAYRNMKISYGNYTVDHAAMYFNTSGDISYFAEIRVSNKCILLRIQPSGQIKVFSCMSEQTINN